MRGRLHRWLARGAVMVAMLAALPFATAGSAAAAVHADNAYVHGWADWTWGADRLTNVSMSVADDQCNNVTVYVRLRVYKMDGTYVSGTARFNTGGCGTTASWSGLSWNPTGGYLIKGVVVHACEDNGVHCVSSTYHDNPNT